MKNLHWFLLLLSAILYAIPFLCVDLFWWIIFIFPVPLLYITRTQNLSFMHGYVWGIFVFLFHLHPGILIIANLAGDSWWIGLLMGGAMVLYQACMPAVLFWLATKITVFFSVESPIVRLLVWTGALAIFIFWTDRSCMWIFDMQGYPFMHPLLPITQNPSLLCLLPIMGKQLLLMFFLLVPASIVIVLWYKNYASIALCITVLMPWIWSGMHQSSTVGQPVWYKQICSLPCMIRAHSASATVRILSQNIDKTLTAYPEAFIIVMPESAFDIMDDEMLDKLNEYCLGTSLHLICGTCVRQGEDYYNALYWIHNGLLQARYDKKHTMLMTERLVGWMNVDWLRTIYFKDGISITPSGNERKLLQISESVAFVPYVCSELFCNEYPDDCYPGKSIIAIVNDTLLINSSMHNLLVLLAQFKAIQWQRDIVYVSYGTSVCIDKQGMCRALHA